MRPNAEQDLHFLATDKMDAPRFFMGVDFHCVPEIDIALEQVRAAALGASPVLTGRRHRLRRTSLTLSASLSRIRGTCCPD